MKKRNFTRYDLLGEKIELADMTFVEHDGLPAHLHEGYAVSVSRGGFHTLSRNRDKIQINPGDLVTVDPGIVHRNDPADREGFAVTTLYVPTGIICRLFGTERAPLFLRTLADDGLKELTELIPLLYTGASQTEVESLLVSMMAHLIDTSKTEPAHEKVVRDAIDYLHAYASDPISLEDVADEVGVSQFSLCRRFSKEMGISPHQYLIRLRVERARIMLLDGMSATDAAFASGFADQSHLTRSLKKIYGITPGKTRNK